MLQYLLYIHIIANRNQVSLLGLEMLKNPNYPIIYMYYLTNMPWEIWSGYSAINQKKNVCHVQ